MQLQVKMTITEDQLQEFAKREVHVAYSVVGMCFVCICMYTYMIYVCVHIYIHMHMYMYVVSNLHVHTLRPDSA